MNVQKTRQRIALASLRDDERNRAALARLKARMTVSGDLRLQRQVDDIVELATGVRP